jgi:hypothetical protein
MWLAFIIEIQCVYCEVETLFTYRPRIQIIFMLQMLRGPLKTNTNLNYI